MLRHPLVYLGEVLFGHGEGDVDGVDLVNVYQRNVIRLHDVALFHQNVAGASVDGRFDVAVLDLKLGVLDGGAIGCQGGIQGFKSGLLQLVVLTGHHAGFEEGLVTFGIRVGVLGVRGIFR